MIVTRLAPSPTGIFHIGSLRTAIYNYLFAKKNEGKFILRIEDTDKERSKKEYESEIIKVFELFNLDYDDLKYQSKNIDEHSKYLEELIKMNKVYKSDEGPYKFKVKRDVDHFEYNDEILGNIKIPNKNIEDFSVARSDKSPTFILSNVIDDHMENITHVIRGNDHSINTIKQMMISEAISLKPINYAHIPLIHDMSGKKLSKRGNITNVLNYLEMGYQRDALFNFIIKLGNSFKGNTFQTSFPPGIQTSGACGDHIFSRGSDLSGLWSSIARIVYVNQGSFEVGDWRTMPVPPLQQNMPSANSFFMNIFPAVNVFDKYKIDYTNIKLPETAEKYLN